MQGILSLLLHPRRLLTILAGIFATIAYVWIAAVRAVPGVRRRKDVARAGWRAKRATRSKG
ncbi:hypothetical protein BH20ACT14_BH20ACT14_16610 [soil metagenome]